MVGTDTRQIVGADLAKLIEAKAEELIRKGLNEVEARVSSSTNMSVQEVKETYKFRGPRRGTPSRRRFSPDRLTGFMYFRSTFCNIFDMFIISAFVMECNARNLRSGITGLGRFFM